MNRLNKNYFLTPSLKWFQKYYYSYKRDESRKLKEAEEVLTALNLNLAGAPVLEIGPANGYFLDVCMKHGAKSAGFIDIDPYFYYYLKVKGYKEGILGNHWKAVHKLKGQKYSLIYSKGAMIVDDLLMRRERSFAMMSEWLSALEKATVNGGVIVICPHWRDVPASAKRQYTGNILENDFVKFILEKGYSPLKFIEGHNIEPNYPVTFWKRV
ncbi:MAG: hypothetical protein HYY40_01370 [Bacteroidetes bacterium]|nr:hypothetical protein [Bacteroidota bacterium]